MIENDSILKEIYEQISVEPKIEILYEDEISGIEFHPSKVDVSLKSGTKTSSKLLIGSDGNLSKVK